MIFNCNLFLNFEVEIPFSVLTLHIPVAYLEPCQTTMMKVCCKNSNGLVVTIFAKKLHRKCLTEFWICLWIYPTILNLAGLRHTP